MKLTVNGQAHELEADPDTPLLYILSDDLKSRTCPLQLVAYGS